MKTIIAGGRDFQDWSLMQTSLFNVVITEVVSGRAKGADQMGEWYAQVNNLPMKLFPADWEKFGRGAGIIRNCEMAEYAEQLVAFWDGVSRGTSHMITHFKTKYPNKPITIIRYPHRKTKS